MASSTIARGNLLIDTIFGINITPPASITTATAVLATYTVQGLQVGDLVTPFFTSAVANYSMINAWVSAANTLAIYFSTETGATVTSTPAVNIVVNWQRYELNSFSQLPTNAL